MCHSIIKYALMSNTEPECTGTDIRLINGNVQYSGTVQICHNGFWSIICGYGWDDTDASVACRQLGISPLGITLHIRVSGVKPAAFLHAISVAVGDVDFSFSSNAPILLDLVACSGSEEHLTDCGHAGLGVHYCTAFDGEATVLCITGIYTVKYLMGTLTQLHIGSLTCGSCIGYRVSSS